MHREDARCVETTRERGRSASIAGAGLTLSVAFVEQANEVAERRSVVPLADDPRNREAHSEGDPRGDEVRFDVDGRNNGRRSRTIDVELDAPEAEAARAFERQKDSG